MNGAAVAPAAPHMTSRTWKIELTFDELATIEHALARASADDIAVRLGCPSDSAGTLVSRLLKKTAGATARPHASSLGTPLTGPSTALLHGVPLMVLDEP